MTKINTINDILYLYPLFIVMFVIWIPIAAAKWDDYNPGAGGIKWLPNCDYPGFDIASQPITEKLCGRTCIDTIGCNAFSWHDGWCFLKKITADIGRSPLTGGRCGVLPWEFDETSASQIIQPINNFAKSVVNQNNQMMQPVQHQQINPQRQQLLPGKSQMKTQNIFQVGSSKNSNQFPFFRGKQKNPNVLNTETDDSNNKNYDDSDGYQDGDYHDNDEDNNQPISNDYRDDNQSGESVNDDNQLVGDVDNDYNLPNGNIVKDLNQPESDYQEGFNDNEPDEVDDQDY
jgi:hypothetical protein